MSSLVEVLLFMFLFFEEVKRQHPELPFLLTHSLRPVNQPNNEAGVTR